MSAPSARKRHVAPGVGAWQALAPERIADRNNRVQGDAGATLDFSAYEIGDARWRGSSKNAHCARRSFRLFMQRA